MKKKWIIHIAIAIFLIGLGLVNYLYLQHVAPLHLQDKSFQYTGKCVNIDREIKEFGKTNRIMYLLSMDMDANSGSTVFTQSKVSSTFPTSIKLCRTTLLLYAILTSIIVWAPLQKKQ